MLDALFFKKVNKTNSCWIWTGATRPNGYGVLKRFGKLYSAHRYSFELYNYKITKDMVICHTCDNRLCVNPKHLWEGTQSENMFDASKKGRLNIKKIYNTPTERKKAQWDRYYNKNKKEILLRRKNKRSPITG